MQGSTKNQSRKYYSYFIGIFVTFHCIPIVSFHLLYLVVATEIKLHQTQTSVPMPIYVAVYFIFFSSYEVCFAVGLALFYLSVWTVSFDLWIRAALSFSFSPHLDAWLEFELPLLRFDCCWLDIHLYLIYMLVKRSVQILHPNHCQPWWLRNG